MQFFEGLPGINVVPFFLIEDMTIAIGEKGNIVDKTAIWILITACRGERNRPVHQDQRNPIRVYKEILLTLQQLLCGIFYAILSTSMRDWGCYSYADFGSGRFA
jgi:hypothetical protein